MNIKRNIFLIYCYTFCVSSIFIMPVLIPYFNNQIGATYQQFLFGEALFAAMILIMEVPSGWLSDMWSRKKTLFLAVNICAIGYGFLLFATNVYVAMVGQAIIGIGIAFHSGTVTSLIYDTLAQNGKEHLYKKLEGKRHGISLYSVAGASIVGGVLYQYNAYLPLSLDIVTLILAGIFALLIVEPKRIKKPVQKNPINDMIVTMKYALHGHREIAGIILVAMVLFSTTKMFLWMQQPYMMHVDIPVEYFGYITAGGFLLGGVSGHLGHYIRHNLSNRQTMMAMSMSLVFAGGLAIVISAPPSIAFILFGTMISGYGFPYMQNAINKHADPTRRATILSTAGLFMNLFIIPASFALGWFHEHYDITYSLGYVIGQLAIFSMIGLWLWRKNTSP